MHIGAVIVRESLSLECDIQIHFLQFLYLHKTDTAWHHPEFRSINPLRPRGGGIIVPPLEKNAFFDVKFIDLFKNIFRK